MARHGHMPKVLRGCRPVVPRLCRSHPRPTRRLTQRTLLPFFPLFLSIVLPPPLPSCKGCASGYYRSSSSAQAACPKGRYCPGSCTIKACSPGTYQDQVQRTSCKDCPYNQYQDQAGQDKCKACSAGYYRDSASQQSRCEAGFRCSNCGRARCTGESYQDQVGQTACKGASLCNRGEFERSGPTAVSDRKCSSCTLYATYQDQAKHASRACKTVATCSPGEYVSLQPTLSSNRVCSACGDRTYSTR